MNFLTLEILVPVFHVAETAARKGHNTILFGSAAEELFVGYERYYQYRDEGRDVDSILREEFKTLPQRDMAWVKKVCRHFGIEARFPLYNRELAETMFSVPLEERMDDRELKKGILREAGKVLGAPSEVLKRRKRAMQYGSGIHKLLLKNSKEINKHYPAS
jgi:asparagine synthase (glutamine-hydrolysing)